MRELSNEERKAYNRYARKHNSDLAVANAVAPFLIIGSLIGGCLIWDFSPFLAKGIFIFGAAVLIGRMFSGVHVNDPHNHTDSNNH